MTKGRVWAIVIGGLGMTQTLRHDLGTGVQALIGVPSIPLLFYGFGITGKGK
jgi:hypothetical protein